MDILFKMRATLFVKYFNSLGILKKIILISVFTVLMSVIIFTILVEGTHDVLTENCNRYGQDFSLSSFCWHRFFLVLAAYIMLLYPWWKYSISKKTDYKWRLFPGFTKEEKLLSFLLTALNVITGGCYTFVFWTYSYILYVKKRIMLADEIGLESFALIGCILFWGTINFLYRKMWDKY